MYTTDSKFRRAGFDVNQTICWKMLTNEQCEEIFVTVAELLERDGAQIESAAARKVFTDNGCWADGNMVHIPSAKLDWAIRTAPSRITMCDQSGKRAMLLETENNHFGPGSFASKIVDAGGKEPRDFKADDLVTVARLCQSLKEVDFAAPAFACNGPEAFATLSAYCSKPVIVPAANAAEVDAIADMAAVAVGGADNLLHNPYVAVTVANHAARLHDADALDAVIEAATKGIPCIYQTTLIAGETAPAQTAGTIVVALANVLVAVCLSQMVAEGAPIICGGIFTIADEGDTVPFGAPESALISAGFANALRYLRLPSAVYGCFTGSAISDAQYGAEATYSLLSAVLSGANIIQGGGILEAGRQWSPACFVITDETMGQVRRIISSLVIDEDRKAIGVYAEVEPGGYYLDQDHTTRYYKSEQYWPHLMSRKRIPDWEKGGSKTLGMRGDDYVSELLGGSGKALMDDSKLSQIKQILAKSGK